MKETALVQQGGTAVEPFAPEDNSVPGLMRLALDKNVDVNLLERLVAMQERAEERNNRDAFFRALAEFQELCPPIRKNKTADIVSKKSGAKFSYSYATLDHLQAHIRPHLKTCNLSYSFDVEQHGKDTLIVWCVLRHVDGHSERAQFPVPVEIGGRMSDAQANGAALSYGKRQALSAVLGLSIEEDVDGAKPESKEPISEEQAANISDLCEQAGGERPKAQLLKWLKAETIAEIVADDYDRAVKVLKDRIAEL